MTEKRSDYRRRQAEQAEKANRQEAADSAAFPASKQDQETLKAESLKKRLNFAILVVCLLIILVWVILLKF